MTPKSPNRRRPERCLERRPTAGKAALSPRGQSGPDREALLSVLAGAQRLGFFGPGPLEPQIERALAFCDAVEDWPGGLAVDLGTGGGLPGLVLACAWPASRWLFVEANRRRCLWLQTAVQAVGLQEVTVVNERAEVVGRGPYRHTASLVTARSFAPPAATAECAAPLLRVGGRLLVTGPPDEEAAGTARWPVDGLALLGLRLARTASFPTPGGPASLSIIESTGVCDDRYPRRTGVPTKHPLFGAGKIRLPDSGL